MSDQAQVWILDNGQKKVSIAFAELVAVIQKPTIYNLPYAHSWSYCFAYWQNNIIPIIDLSARLITKTEASLLSTTNKEDVLCILAYPVKEGVAYGGFLTQALPYDININNDMACHLPAPEWQAISRSCFSYQSEAIPILNISAMYTATTPME